MSFDNSFTAVTGATYTAAQYNTYVRDNLTALHDLIEAVYYVGIVIESVVSTNPATILGFGTWAAFGAGRGTVGLDATQTEFDTVEKTGGAKTVTLTASEMPTHAHNVTIAGNGVQGVSSGAQSAYYPYGSTVYTTVDAGGGAAHNNLQPYIVVYRWKRTA